MATPTADTYTAPTGTTVVRGGRITPPVGEPVFSSVIELSTGSSAPFADLGQTLILNLHGSGNTLSALANSRFMQATLNPANAWGAYDGDNTFIWKELNGGVQPDGNRSINVWPNDKQPNNGVSARESDWCGWMNGPDTGEVRLYTERRVDAMLDLLLADPRYSATKRVLTGTSMGGWGTMSFGIRRPHIFPMIVAGVPRWRYSQVAGQVSVHDWDVAALGQPYNVASAPDLVAADGGYSIAEHFDHIAYVTNTANAVPWIGWVIGKNDGYMPFQDHIDAIAALRAAGRGFAVSWNLGNHGGQPNIETIFASYTRGMFEIGKGYPIFSDHSLDSDPATADVGGINMGLKFRSVAESDGAWSCEVAHISSACTVKVKPHSSVYVGDATPKTVTITAANTWAAVSFP